MVYSLPGMEAKAIYLVKEKLQKYSYKIEALIKKGLSEQKVNDNNEQLHSSVEILKQLKELLDLGAITEDEFNTKKEELLKKI